MSKTRLLITLCLLVVPAVITGYLNTDRVLGWDDVVEFLLAFMAITTLLVVVASALRHRRDGSYGSYALNRPDGLWLSLRRIAGSFISFFFPDVGVCWRCYVSWAVVKPHLTTVSDYQGYESFTFFAICKVCWRDATMEEKKQFYLARYATLFSKGMQPTYRIDHHGTPHNADVRSIFNALEAEDDQRGAA
jgi:hypothetical protein